jgi:hypothetical protein
MKPQDYRLQVEEAMAKVEELLYMCDRGIFYEDYDQSLAALDDAKQGLRDIRQEIRRLNKESYLSIPIPKFLRRKFND